MGPPAKRPQQREIQRRDPDPEVQASNLRRRDDAQQMYDALATTPEERAGSDWYYMTPERAEALARRRRNELIASAKPDQADIAIRDTLSGRVRRARQGSSSSALGAFSVSSALGADSMLGG